MNHVWIIATGMLAASSCALIGSYLILRKMAMVGDAISHAVLPGIVVAFLMTHSRNTVPMLIGAGIVGILTSFIIEVLHRAGRVQQDASIGVTFTWLFAVGVILVSAFTAQVDLDLDCVLYGEIAYVPWDRWLSGGHDLGPRSIWILGVTLLFNLAFVGLFFKELKISSFDPALARTLGIPVTLVHYLLMAAVSMTTVASFESVGAILVVAMLTVPGAAAFLLTKRLKALLVLSVIFACLSAALGYVLAYAIDSSIAGAMAVVAGGILLLAFLFNPKQGVFWSLIGNRKALEPPEATTTGF
jgi:manganese/zinc/iron transport system permease protein